MDSGSGTSDARRALHLVVLAAGGSSMLLGIAVLAGWYTRTVSLIQVLPAFVPMQYNTALGFLLCGTAMLGVATGRDRMGSVYGGIAAALGALTLIEYAGLNLGIDELLMEDYVTVGTSDPGRMAPNTALCFFLAGAGLLLASRFSKHFLLSGGLGSLVLGLGATALIGYLSGASSAYGWGQMTQMAVHTSAGFIALGLGMVSLAMQRRTVPERAGDPTRQRRQIVALSIVIMAGVSLGVAVVVIRELRSAAVEDRRGHLSVLTRGWAEVIGEAVDEAQGDSPSTPQEEIWRRAAAASRRLAASSEALRVIGDSGDLVLARHEGERIVLVASRQATLDGVGALRAEWGEPMRRALAGESGTLIGRDYRGELVLAAYRPVGPYGWGLVGKVEVAEIGAPFVTAAWLAAGVGLVLVVIGAIAVLLTIDPTIRGLTYQTVQLQREVAERRRAEEELRRYEQLVSCAPDMLALLDEQYVYLAANPAYLQAFDQASDAVVGRTVPEVFGEEFFSSVIKPHGERCLSGETASYRDWFEFPATGRRYMDIAYAPFRGPDDEILGITVAARDITAAKEAEDRLERSRALLAETGRLAGVGGWELDGETLEFAWTDETFRIHELPIGRLPSLEEATDFYHPDDIGRMETVVRRAFQHGEGWDGEFRLTTAKGKQVWTRSIGKAVTVDGKTVTIFGAIQDVTARKEVEADVAQSARSLRALAVRLQRVREDERTQIARQIHDEFGDALTGLRMDLSRQKERAADGPPGRAHSADAAIALADDMIEKLRDLWTRLRPPLLDDLGAVAAIEWHTQEFATRTGIACELDMEAGPGTLTAEHATALFRIAEASLENVEEHAAADRCEVSLRVADGLVVLRVADNGKGITKEESEGPGSLGLLGMRERALAVSGRLEVRRVPQGGTEVAFSFPVSFPVNREEKG